MANVADPPGTGRAYPTGSMARAPERRAVQFKSTQVIYYILGILEVLLGFRFLLHLFAANAGSGFVSFIFGLSSVFMAPFRTIFPSFIEGKAVFEWPVLVAMVVYAVLALGIARLVVILTTRTPEEEI